MFLTPGDFYIKNNQICKYSYKQEYDYSFIFFMTNFESESEYYCKFCAEFMPHFKELIQTLKGVNFYLMDVTQNNFELPLASQNMDFKILSIPLFILYFKGVPIDVFAHDNIPPKMVTKEMIKFILQHVQHKNTDATPIPPYSIGIPSNKKSCLLKIPKYTTGIPGNVNKKIKTLKEAYSR